MHYSLGISIGCPRGLALAASPFAENIVDAFKGEDQLALGKDSLNQVAAVIPKKYLSLLTRIAEPGEALLKTTERFHEAITKKLLPSDIPAAVNRFFELSFFAQAVEPETMVQNYFRMLAKILSDEAAKKKGTVASIIKRKPSTMMRAVRPMDPAPDSSNIQEPEPSTPTPLSEAQKEERDELSRDIAAAVKLRSDTEMSIELNRLAEQVTTSGLGTERVTFYSQIIEGINQLEEDVNRASTIEHTADQISQAQLGIDAFPLYEKLIGLLWSVRDEKSLLLPSRALAQILARTRNWDEAMPLLEQLLKMKQSDETRRLIESWKRLGDSN